MSSRLGCPHFFEDDDEDEDEHLGGQRRAQLGLLHHAAAIITRFDPRLRVCSTSL
jgi:hypothetical protein